MSGTTGSSSCLGSEYVTFVYVENVTHTWPNLRVLGERLAYEPPSHEEQPATQELLVRQGTVKLVGRPVLVNTDVPYIQ